MTDSDLRKTNFYKLLNWLQIRSNKMLKSKQPSLYQGIPIRATFDASTSKTKLASVSAAVAIYNFCDFFSPNWILIGIDNQCSAIPHSGKHAFPRQKTQKTAFCEEKCALQNKSLVAVVTSQFINLIEFLRDLLHLSNPRRFTPADMKWIEYNCVSWQRHPRMVAHSLRMSSVVSQVNP